jgi:putative heme transporter
MAASRRDKLIWLAGLAAIVVVFVWVVPRVASYADIWRALHGLSIAELELLLGLGLAVIALNGLSAVATLPGLSWRRGVQGALCGNFLTALFPTGADLAVRYAMYRSWGFAAGEATTAIAVAGVGRYLTMLMLPIAGTSAVLITGRGDDQTPWLFGLGVLAFVVLVGLPWLLLRREDLALRFAHRLAVVAARLAGVLRRQAPPDIADRVLRARGRITVGVRRRAPLVVLAQVLATAVSFVVLYASLRTVGLRIPPSVVLYAYALGMIAGLVPLTPGNVGVTELILIGLLGYSTDSVSAHLVAATLLFRIFVWFLPIPLGMAAFLWWRYTSAANRR